MFTRFANSIREFFSDVTGELKKVSFPTRAETIGSTTVVIVFCIIMSLYLSAVDSVDMRRAAALTSGYLTHRILPTTHTRTESTADRYRDMMIQKTMTTVVDPIVSALVGNETFFNSPFTSPKNSRMELINLVNMPTPSARQISPLCYLPTPGSGHQHRA